MGDLPNDVRTHFIASGDNETIQLSQYLFNVG